MSGLRVLYHNIQASLIFHAERLKLIPTKYPRRIVQKKLDSSGFCFEVHDINEANRVRFLDEEETFMSQILAELNMEDIFFDVGACIGLFSLHAAKRCKHVFAFEPEPDFREHLEQNLRINNLRNVTALPYAIADRSKSFSLFTNGTAGKSPSLENDNFKNKVEVQARTLSDLVFRDHVPAPTIIKMDIEGAEILALKGMTELFSRNPPRSIFLELHPMLLTHFNSSAAEVLSLLEDVGYKAKKHRARDQQIHYTFELDKVVAG